MAAKILTSISTVFSPAWARVVLGSVVVAGLGAGGYQELYVQPKVISPTGPSLGVANVSNAKPITIVFNRPVNQKSLHYEIHPDLNGDWDISTNTLRGQSTLRFTPTESPDLDTRYTVALTGIKSTLGKTSENYLLSFQTASFPAIKAVSPVHESVDILPDAPITFTLDKFLPDGAIMTAALEPEVTLGAAEVHDSIVSFAHASPLQKNTKYSLKAFVTSAKINYQTGEKTVSTEKTELISSTFTTIPAPGIETYTPSGADVDPATTIRIVFRQAMDQATTQAAFSMGPAVNGTHTWENEKTMVFTPEKPLSKAQLYTVLVTKNAKAANGVAFEEDFSWQFSTIGAAAVTSSSPGNGATNVDPATSISVTFNQAVNEASAQSKFSISPSVTGTFNWSGNTMVFKPSGLEYNKSYTVSVASGVTAVKGTNSVSNFSAKFTTRSQSVMLKVPAYAQAHMYSCMIAAARSALAFRGVSASESAIIARVGQDKTAWSGTWGKDGATWGDPDAAMVGGLDNGPATAKSGSSTKVTWGYGSHWGPISRVLTSYGVGNEVKRNMTVQALAQSIADGNPVIIWWVNGIWPSYVVNWKTPAGKSIRGVNGLHVQVVRGFNGTVDNPTSFTVTDSGYGYPGRTFDVGTFKAKWSWFSNTGIIVK